MIQERLKRYIPYFQSILNEKEKVKINEAEKVEKEVKEVKKIVSDDEMSNISNIGEPMNQ